MPGYNESHWFLNIRYWSLAQNSQPLDLEEARQRLYAQLPVVPGTSTLSIANAYGRVLAETVHASIDLPPFNASAMDGYAVRLHDFLKQQDQGLPCIGESLAGHPYLGEFPTGACVRIFTGARVPDGADQVLLQEEVERIDGNRIIFTAQQPAESYVRPQGHDMHKGSPVADAGECLRGFTLGALATAGVDAVKVYALPRVGIFSTGDELVDPGTPPAKLAPGQIYDSNRFTVINLLRDTPCITTDLGRLPDEPVRVRTALQDASENHDLLITSGGVSVGEADFITSTIEELGELTFWRLNLKPGKPFAFGRIDNCHIFGLPGNPVSTIVTLLLLAKPAICHVSGMRDVPVLRVPATLQGQLLHSPGRMEFQRGIARQTAQGVTVTVTGDQSSNRMSTFQGANCLIEVPKESGDLQTGDAVVILPFTGLLG